VPRTVGSFLSIRSAAISFFADFPTQKRGLGRFRPPSLRGPEVAEPVSPVTNRPPPKQPIIPAASSLRLVWQFS